MVTNTNSSDGCLPFAMPTKDTLFNSSHRVFAHYMYVFPLSIDTEFQPRTTTTFSICFPVGKITNISTGWFSALKATPSCHRVDLNTYQLLNMEREVRMAIARGITGFQY